MNMDYRPEKHAQALETWAELLVHQAREIAALRGDVARLLHALPRGAAAQERDEALDALLAAIFAALGDATWIVTDLDPRMLASDPAGRALLSAVHALGKTGARELGIYLARAVPGESRATVDGYELRRVGRCDGCLAWSVARV